MSEFVRVAAVSEIPVGTSLKVSVNDKDVAVVHSDEGVFALSDICSHADVSLSEGEVIDCTIECWLHGSQFNLRTGAPLSPPAIFPVPTYEVRIVTEGDDEYIEVATEPNPVNTDGEQ